MATGNTATANVNPFLTSAPTRAEVITWLTATQAAGSGGYTAPAGSENEYVFTYMKKAFADNAAGTATTEQKQVIGYVTDWETQQNQKGNPAVVNDVINGVTAASSATRNVLGGVNSVSQLIGKLFTTEGLVFLLKLILGAVLVFMSVKILMRKEAGI